MLHTKKKSRSEISRVFVDGDDHDADDDDNVGEVGRGRGDEDDPSRVCWLRLKKGSSIAGGKDDDFDF